jgi:hypothetical protein
MSAAALLSFAPQVDLAFCWSGILWFEFWPSIAQFDPLYSAADGHRTKAPWTRFHTTAVRFFFRSLVHNLHLSTDRGTQLVLGFIGGGLTTREATRTYPLSENWLRDATSKPRKIQTHSGNLIPALRNTEHSCSRQGSAAAWLTSPRPGNVIPVPKTSALLRVGVPCLSSSQRSITLIIMSLFAMNYFARNFWPSNSLHCLNETAEACELSDSVFQTQRKRLALRALCPPLPPDQFCSLPPALERIKLSDEDSI